MHIIRLIHWNEEEAREKAFILGKRDFKVIYHVIQGKHDLSELRNKPPDIIVIDLSRLPSQGRDIGMFIRQSKSTRYVPLIFVEGKKEKIDRIKKLLPDAFYTTWNGVHRTIKRAVSNPLKDPVAPKSLFDAYKGIPLQKKLGIRADAVLALLNAPEDFERRLIGIPRGVKIHRMLKEKRDLTLWFVRTKSQLMKNITPVSKYSSEGPIWILWPKKGSDITSDLSQVVVRKIGLASGLVDYKICSVDGTWSGLLFTKRKK